jgi:uncharacterized protein (TIGR03437 family)
VQTGIRFSGMSFDAAGNIYGTSSLHSVLKITPDGHVFVVAGSAIEYSIPIALGDGGPAIAAAMTPGKVVSDPSGNLYISDFVDNRIRKVNAATGIISTIAGNGIADYGGDGGLAVGASFNDPGDLLLDGQGNLYVADYLNARVRKISLSTGIVTTVAGSGAPTLSGDGGLALAAGIGYPSNIALNAAGSQLYIIAWNNVGGPVPFVRMVDFTTGRISTVAGNGSIGFSGEGGQATAGPIFLSGGMTVDAAGNLYISELTGDIRKISNGVITTFAGNPNGTGAGPLINPGALAFDPAGNLLFMDGAFLRKLANGVTSTVAGNGSWSLSGDGGPALSASFDPGTLQVDPAGDLLMADPLNSVIRRVSIQSGTISTAAGIITDRGTECVHGYLVQPSSLAVDELGNIFTAASLGPVVCRVDANTGVVTDFAGTGALDPNTGMALGYGFGGDGGPATRALLSTILGLAADNNGNVYLSDSTNSRVRKVSAGTGIITTIAGNGQSGFNGDGAALQASLNSPGALAVDATGNLYIADVANYRVRRLDHATGQLTTVLGNGTKGAGTGGNAANKSPISNVTALAVDSAGDLFVADAGNSRILLISGGNLFVVAGTGVPFFFGDGGDPLLAGVQPVGLAVSKGVVYVADQAGRIRSFNLVIPKLQQSISFASIPDRQLTDSQFSLSASSSSGLPVAFAVLSGPAIVSGNLITLTGLGTVTIQASQAGNATYSAASPVVQSFHVLGPTISITSILNGGYLRGTLAPDSYGYAFGTNLGGATPITASAPLPTVLGGVSISLTDVTGTRFAVLLYYVSQIQVNFLLPPGIATGTAQLVLSNSSGQSSPQPVSIFPVSPALFSADGTGTGQAAGQLTQLGGQVYAVLYGTGIRNAKTISATVGNVAATVNYAGPQGQFPGLDQVNLQFPAGALNGSAILLLTADNTPANLLNIVLP